MITPTQTPTAVHGDRSISYRWEIGPSAHDWLGTPGTDVAELHVHHSTHRKQFVASLHQLTVFANGGTRQSYALTAPSWSPSQPVARDSTARLHAFAEQAPQQLRDADPDAIAFAFTQARAA